MRPIASSRPATLPAPQTGVVYDKYPLLQDAIVHAASTTPAGQPLLSRAVLEGFLATAGNFSQLTDRALEVVLSVTGSVERNPAMVADDAKAIALSGHEAARAEAASRKTFSHPEREQQLKDALETAKTTSSSGERLGLVSKKELEAFLALAGAYNELSEGALNVVATATAGDVPIEEASQLTAGAKEIAQGVFWEVMKELGNRRATTIDYATVEVGGLYQFTQDQLPLPPPPAGKRWEIAGSPEPDVFIMRYADAGPVG